ncbi:hypothetical protein NDU88_001712 [Pleurodeles waltl]|uniref:Uncharacterized protein n=1 Tax=Pleurodeles waltl TaxID=8319 RepID=A0AAV7LDL2_PLEWA|nr:hypothetical protein NDU88_001712 [Pleurodeles waltl]
MSRSQPSTSATKSASAVVRATPGRSKGAPIRAASVPQTEKKYHPIPPPAKVKKGPASSRRQSHHPPSKASPKHRVDSAKVSAATVKMWQGHKPKGTSPLGTMSPGEGLVTTKLSGWQPHAPQSPPPLQLTPAQPPALPPALPLPQYQSAASSPRISHPRLPQTVWCLQPPQLSPAPRPALAASPPQPPPPAPPSAPPRAHPMPLCRPSASSVCSRQSLQVTSWTLDMPLETPPPALTRTSN